MTSITIAAGLWTLYAFFEHFKRPRKKQPSLPRLRFFRVWFIICSVLTVLALMMFVFKLAGLVTLFPALFWIPITIASFGVAGSSYLQICTILDSADTQETSTTLCSGIGDDPME